MSARFLLVLACATTGTVVAGPHFIARRTDGNSDVKVEASAVAIQDADRRDSRAQCEGACGAGVDATCVPQCMIEMYDCIKAQTEEHQQCTKGVVTKYIGFSANWASQSFATKLSASSLSSEDRRAIHGQCEAACGEGVDSSCIPQCEIEMYTCRNHASHTDEHKQCNEDVLKKYKNFGGNWDATHLEKYSGHFSLQSASEVSSMLGACKAACGSGVDSSCVPQCQAEMFTCKDHDRITAAEAQQKCQEKVADKYKSFGKKWDETHLFVAVRIATAEERMSINSQCQSACGEGVDSSCVPRCEIAMYDCLNHASHTEERKECNARVLKEFAQFGKTWDADHLAHHVLVHNKHHTMTVADHKALHFQCKAACGDGVDSSCVPACEAKMFACLDYEDSSERSKCSDGILAEYKKFGETWDRNHGAKKAL